MLVTVDNLNDLKNHSRSITKSAMTYSNHTARQINPNLYQVPYIGNASTALQVEMDLKLVQELTEDLKKITTLLEKKPYVFKIVTTI